MLQAAPIKVVLFGEDKLSKEFKKSVKNIKKIGAGLKSVGQKMTVGITAPIVGIGIAAAKSSNDLTKSMRDVATLIPGQAARLKGLRSEVIELGRATGKQFGNIAGGVYEVFSAFGTAASPIKKTSIALKAAVAGGSSTAESLKLLSAVTKGYGDTTNEAVQKVADLSFMTVKLGQTKFPELAASMGSVVPLAVALKVSQEELYGSYAALTGVTGNASEVTTQLKSVIGGLMDPTKAMTKMAKKAGYSSAVQMAKTEGLIGVMERLKAATGGELDQMALYLTRKEAQTAAVSLGGSLLDDFKEKTLAMGRATGAAGEAFKEQIDPLERFNRSIGAIGDKIGGRILPAVERFIDRIMPAVDWVSGLDDATIDLGLSIAAVAAVMGPVIMVMGSLVTGVAALMPLLAGAGGLAGVMSTVGAVLTGPVGIALAAIVAGFVLFREELQPVIDIVQELAQDVFGALKDALGGVIEIVKAVLAVVKPIVGLFLSIVAVGLRAYFKAFSVPLKIAAKLFKLLGAGVRFLVVGAKYLLTKLVDLTTGWLKSTKAGQAVLDMFSAIKDSLMGVVEWVSEALDGVYEFFDKITGLISSASDEMEKEMSGEVKKKIVVVPPEGGFDGDGGTLSSFADENPFATDASITQALDKQSATKIEVEFKNRPEGVDVRATPKDSNAVLTTRDDAIMENF